MDDIKALRARAQRLRSQGLTCQQVADRLGMSGTWVHKWTEKSGKPYKMWTEQETALLQRMLADGKPFSKIAKKMCRSRNAIAIKVHRSEIERECRDDRQAREIRQLLLANYLQRFGISRNKLMRAIEKSDIADRDYDLDVIVTGIEKRMKKRSS